jgi:mannose-1-phosphate guanylyltransferase
MAIAGMPNHRSGNFGPLSAGLKFDRYKQAAVILAGGEGLRLSSFTRKVFGYHVPKQFCPLFERETLLERTLRRVSPIVPPVQTITVLTEAHERFYTPLLASTPSSNLLIQPDNRGTAAAIMGALYRLIAAGHDGAVAILPSDHYVSDDSIFMRHVAAAFRAVEMAPRLNVLLGIEADGPETEYGWIEPGAPVASSPPALGQIKQIRRFWEKPSPDLARYLHGRDCLWNSFVLVANASMLLSLMARALPEMHRAFAPIVDDAADDEILRSIFSDLPSADFSASVLVKFPQEFSVLPVTGVSWSDLGDPRRLLAAISNDGGRIAGGNHDVFKT